MEADACAVLRQKHGELLPRPTTAVKTTRTGMTERDISWQQGTQQWAAETMMVIGWKHSDWKMQFADELEN